MSNQLLTIPLNGYFSVSWIIMKVESIYDSITVRRIFKRKDPNIKLRVDDILKY